MSAENDPELVEAEAVLWEADRELGRQAFEIAIAHRFPGFNELVYTGARRDEPQLIYRGDDSFLVVDTTIRDPHQEQAKTPKRQLSDGRSAERGTREYLLAGLQRDDSSSMVDRSLGSELLTALSAGRVRYILVTINITESSGEREIQSVKLTEFEL